MEAKHTQGERGQVMAQRTIRIRTETVERIEKAQAEYIGRTRKPIDRSEYLDRVSRYLTHIHDLLVKEQATH
jgi:hypothetical protein